MLFFGKTPPPPPPPAAKNLITTLFELLQPPPPPPPPAASSFLLWGEVETSLGILVGLIMLVLVVALVRRRFFIRHVDAVTAILRSEHEKFTADEDQENRLRFTPGRLAKSLPDGGVFDAIFIGSGPGSLACAATMARIGWRCAVFEQGEQLGGGSHVFPERGYEFETGVHYLGDDHGTRSLLDFLTCGRLELAPIGTPVGAPKPAGDADGRASPVDVTESGIMYDNVIIEGKDYKFLAGDDKLLAMLRRGFPDAASAKQIDAFEALLRHHQSEAYQASAAMFFTLKVPYLLDRPCLRWLRRLLQTRVMGRHYYRSTQTTSEQMLEACGIPVGSELGAVILGQYGDSGMRPDKLSQTMHLGVMMHYANGACYPVGGSGQIPRKLNAVVRAAGGRSFTQATVSGLLTAADGRTCIGVTVNGVDVRGKVVVSGIGAYRTYEKIVRPMRDPALAAAAADAMRRIEATTELTVAFIFLFLGLDISSQPAEELDRRSHNTWIYPSRHYTDMEKAIEASPPWSQPMPMFVASGSAKDAAWESNNKGKKTVVVLSQCPWEWVKPWAHLEKAAREKDPAYIAFKASAEAAMMEQGFRKVFPHLERYVVHSSVGTPLTTNTFLGTTCGECYGRSATPARWLCPDFSPYTPVPNLLLTGQDVVTLGLPGAVASGYLTANVLAGYGSWENVLLQREIVADLGLGKIF